LPAGSVPLTLELPTTPMPGVAAGGVLTMQSHGCSLKLMWAFVLSTFAAGSALAHVTVWSKNVRSTNSRIQEVIQYALDRSESFKDLLVTLDGLDRVVLVEEGPCPRSEQRSCLQLKGGGARLLIHLDSRQALSVVAAQLAHELYHAVEIAREPAVVDAASMQELYERIGFNSCQNSYSSCWETRAARAFETLVTGQILRAALIGDGKHR
jgi:hypothetical protein